MENNEDIIKMMEQRIDKLEKQIKSILHYQRMNAGRATLLHSFFANDKSFPHPNKSDIVRQPLDLQT